MKNQKGYTSIELLAVICGLATIAAAIFGIYAVCHFIAKFW